LLPKRPTEDKAADLANVILTEFVMPDQETHVDCAVERIEHDVKVEVLWKLASFNCPSQGLVGFLPATGN